MSTQTHQSVPTREPSRIDSALATAIRTYLADHPELREVEPHTEHPLAGHCYVASEAYHHLSDHTTTPQQMYVDSVSHWFLENEAGAVIDLTGDQFETTPAYGQARGRGFCTAEPSQRAQQVIDAVGWEVSR